MLSDQKPGVAASVRTFPVKSAQAIVTTKPAPAHYPSEYDFQIAFNARKFNVRPDLVRAVAQVESGFNPRARSSKGAMGIMQLMPATAAELGVRNPYDATENIRGGVQYLRQLLDRYEGNEVLALAAYNAGPTSVERYGYQVPPYAETRDYVGKVTERAGAREGALPQVGAPNTTAAQPQRSESTRKPAVPRRIYRIWEVIDGRRVVRYTDEKPSSGPYEVVR
ncbi:MAG: lytic transglycosylase domain-containing protein [Acidobacteria bacterium]|nr:lytic transglycosylase domain-containing protein [Acidobacteriota bacterium]MBI3263406.1 lytic transglycosylase domain-containing protein [Acidobacteriota bacterium]